MYMFSPSHLRSTSFQFNTHFMFENFGMKKAGEKELGRNGNCARLEKPFLAQRLYGGDFTIDSSAEMGVKVFTAIWIIIFVTYEFFFSKAGWSGFATLSIQWHKSISVMWRFKKCVSVMNPILFFTKNKNFQNLNEKNSSALCDKSC